MKKTIKILTIFFLISCNKDEGIDEKAPFFISSVDISSYPEILKTDPVFYDLEGNQKDFLKILKENGVNTVRLRLWENPVSKHSGFDEVKQFSQSLKNDGFKIWLTLHYSDTWADPGKQEIPAKWKGLGFDSLKGRVRAYTKKTVDEIKPDYIQIGNEINSGMLHPYGKIGINYPNFMGLVQEGCSAVRESSRECKIILHFAGIEGSDWFFDRVKAIDYDIIGLSYYPIWHGKSLNALKTTMRDLSNSFDKEVVIAETAYPFTLGWNDWTNNIVGLDAQLILPEYPATAEGQRKFVGQIKALVQELENGIGFSYWGAELIAWKGDRSKDASPWENQALFDFDNKALPVLGEFKSD